VNIFHLDVASCHQHYIRSIPLSVDRIFRACVPVMNFVDRGLLLTRKLLNQGFLVEYEADLVVPMVSFMSGST
jgi:hypothetical protein